MKHKKQTVHGVACRGRIISAILNNSLKMPVIFVGRKAAEKEAARRTKALKKTYYIVKLTV